MSAKTELDLYRRNCTCWVHWHPDAPKHIFCSSSGGQPVGHQPITEKTLVIEWPGIAGWPGRTIRKLLVLFFRRV